MAALDSAHAALSPAPADPALAAALLRRPARTPPRRSATTPTRCSSCCSPRSRSPCPRGRPRSSATLEAAPGGGTARAPRPPTSTPTPPRACRRGRWGARLAEDPLFFAARAGRRPPARRLALTAHGPLRVRDGAGRGEPGPAWRLRQARDARLRPRPRAQTRASRAWSSTSSPTWSWSGASRATRSTPTAPTCSSTASTSPRTIATRSTAAARRRRRLPRRAGDRRERTARPARPRRSTARPPACAPSTSTCAATS